MKNFYPTKPLRISELHQGLRVFVHGGEQSYGIISLVDKSIGGALVVLDSDDEEVYCNPKMLSLDGKGHEL